MLLVKNRGADNINIGNNNEVNRSGNYQSAKNGSLNRETTPIKAQIL